MTKPATPRVFSLRQWVPLTESTGETDVTAKVQAALGQVPIAGTLYIPEGCYLITGVTRHWPISIYGPGVFMVDVNDFGFFCNPGAVSGIDPATGSASWGDLKVVTTVADYNISSAAASPKGSQITASSHGLVQGDVIKFTADLKYGLITDDWIGEIARVLRVIDANNFVTDHQLEDIPAGSAVTKHFRKLPLGRWDLDLSFDAPPGNWAVTRVNNEPLIELLGAINPRIKCTVARSYNRAVQVHSVYCGEIDCRWGDLDDVESLAGTEKAEGYGAVVGGGTCGTRVRVNGGGCRHGFTNSDFTAAGAYSTTLDPTTRFQDVGASRDVTVHDSTVVGAYLAAFDTHTLGKRISFTNCHASFPSCRDITSSGLPTGYQDRAQATTFTGCSVTGARLGWDLFGPTAHVSCTTLVGCRDAGITQKVIRVQSGNPASVVTVSGHVSLSAAMFLDVGASRTVVNNCVSNHMVTTTQSLIQLNDSATLLVSGLTQICGATATATPITVFSSSSANCRLRNMHIIRASDQTPWGLLSVPSGSTLTIDIDDASYSAWLAEGLIRAASAGTITLVSDSWGPRGKRHEYGTAAPATQIHRKGDVVWNSDPDSSEFIGWVCVTAGTPGVWRTFGAISAS